MKILFYKDCLNKSRNRYRWFSFFIVLWGLGLVFNLEVHAQTVTVTGQQNNVIISEVVLSVEGNEVVQTSPSDNVNPEPLDVPVLIKSLKLEDGKSIYATTRKPIVANPNPILGTNEIRANAVEIIRYDDRPFVSHRDPDFFEHLQDVVSTPDLRSYWSIGGQPSIPDGDHFIDFMYKDQVISSGYLLFTERFGNSPIDFIALDENANPIPGTKTVQVRGWQWNSGVNHMIDVPSQTQWLVLFSPIIFEAKEPIHGIRVISVNEPDGKLVFFVNEIFAAPDFAERINSLTGAEAVLNIFDNDELNGFPLNPIDVSMTVLKPFPENTVVLHPDGSVDVPPNTPAGVYTLTYQISTPLGESSTAEVTIEVIDYVPQAMDDYGTVENSFGKDNLLNVLDNDLLNGLPATLENILLTEVENNTSGVLTLNADGSVDVASGTVGGTYELIYQICDKEDPAKCDTATVTVYVEVTLLEAVPDDFGTIGYGRGGIIGNVLTNDRLNGMPLEPGKVQVELIEKDGIVGVELTAEGDLIIPSELAPGEYVLVYEIAESLNSENKDQAEIKFTIAGVQIEANDDKAITDQNRPVVINVLLNDFVNPGELDAETLTIIEQPQQGTVKINSDGSITYTPDVNFSGEDTFVYEICDHSDRRFCDQAKVTITVRPILLDLAKTADAATVVMGEMLTYSIELVNNSEFDLFDVMVEDILPAQLMYLSANPSPEEGNVWRIASIPSGEKTVISIEAIAVTTGEVINTATVSVGEYEDEVAAPPVNILPRPVDLKVSKTSFGKDIYEGNEFEYEITLTNEGSTDAEEVTLVDVLPELVTYLGFFSSDFDGEVQVTGNVISWTVPTVPAGAVLTFTIRVQAIGIGPVMNKVTVSVPDDQGIISPDLEAVDYNQIKRFFIPNVITPGRTDGKNDTFEIKGIQQFAGNKLTILNRNGDHVYESDNYQNDWNAPGLNGGPYYYVLVITDSQGKEQVYKGWVQVIK